MSRLVRWDPFGELMSLRQVMDRLFEQSVVRPSAAIGGLLEGSGVALDMYQTDTDVVVKAALPGVKPEDVEITITGDSLTIKGETKTEEEIERENYFRQERRYGAFTRTITLPSDLRTDQAEASFDNGVLTLTVPKAEEVRPRTIRIQTGQTAETPPD